MKNSLIFKAYLFLLFFALILFVPFLGEKEFQGEEGRRVLIALNMLESKEFLIPKLFAEPYFNKPPLFNWGLALFFKIVGNNSEITARSFSVLTILITSLFLTFLWIRIITPFEKKISFTLSLLPGLIFMTTPEVIDKGLRAEIDAFYTMLITFALFGWFYLYESKKKKWLSFLWAGFFLGLGILTKTFQAILFFYLAYLPYLILQKRWREIGHPSHFLGILTAFLIFMGWALPLTMKIGLTPFIHAWLAEYKSAALAKEMSPLQHIESFTLSALIGFSPWLCFLLLYKNLSFRKFLKEYPMLEKLWLYSFLLFVSSYLFHFFFFGARLRYILPSVGGLVFLSSLSIYYLFKTSYIPRGFQFFLSKFLPLVNLLIGLAFLLYSFFFSLPLSIYFFLFFLGFVALNLLFLWRNIFSIKLIFYYFISYIFLAKQLYVSFYYPLHQTNLNYFRRGALEVGELIKERGELYLCKTVPHHLIYYLKYRFKLVNKIIYLHNCQTFPKDSFILIESKDFNLEKEKLLRVKFLQIRSKSYYLFYTGSD